MATYSKQYLINVQIEILISIIKEKNMRKSLQNSFDLKTKRFTKINRQFSSRFLKSISIIFELIEQNMDKERTLTQEQIAEYKEAFSLLDKDGDGVIETSVVPLLIRSLYKFPTEAQLVEMILEVDPHREGKVEFADFLSLMSRRFPEIDPEEQLLEAFEYFDLNKSEMIPMNQIKHHLMQQGEKFAEGEMEEFFDLITKHGLKVGNEFKYKELAKILACSYIN